VGPAIFVTRFELDGDDSYTRGSEADFEDDPSILLELEQFRRVVDVDAGRTDGVVEPSAHCRPVRIDATDTLRTNHPLGVCVGVDEHGIDVLR